MGLRIIGATILMVMAACGSSRPELYPNDHVHGLEEKRLRRDIDDFIWLGIRSTVKPKLAAGKGETLTSRCTYRLTASKKPLFSS